MDESSMSWILRLATVMESLVAPIARMVRRADHYEVFGGSRAIRLLDTIGLDGVATVLPRAQPPED